MIDVGVGEGDMGVLGVYSEREEGETCHGIGNGGEGQMGPCKFRC